MANPLARIEQAMVAIRRSQTRRTLARMAGARPPVGAPSDEDRAVVEVLDAVEALTRSPAAPAAATVSAVADQLGVDQPRASRTVTRAVDRGLLLRTADAGDARRSLLTLTPSGRDRLAQVRAVRTAVFAEAMAGWTDADQERFAELLTAFVHGLERASSRSRTGPVSPPATSG